MFLENLALFQRIVEKGGLAAAGREMGLSPATVTERLNALESYYGATLLKRTTRAIHVTEEGRTLLDGAARLLAEAEELEARIKKGVDQISGPIRVSAPFDLGRNRVAPLIDRFLCVYPNVTVDLLLSDQYNDMTGEGIDFAVRFGSLQSSSLKIKKIGSNSRIPCATPQYIEEFGAPQSPADLEKHNCLVMRFGQNIDNEWPFNVDGRIIKIPVNGNRMCNDGELVREWCLAGYGIAYKSDWDIKEDLDAGRLIPLLQDYLVAPSQIQIIYPPSPVMARRVRMLMDYIADQMRADQPALDHRG
ncbi:LysR family transcriptional regulator [Terasakiella pusilla]|uniref:LysR family transcriptional regulator n=1 Tax=Terasakiella pusilla TaxID=64973 RepID=UPI00048EB9FB|nr:LysR family transcriptional regulator [Terasakiella pusilla]